MQRKLREAGALSEAIIETAVEAIITINSQGSIELFNPAAEKMFGYTFGEIKGKNVKLLMPHPFHGEHDDYIADYMSTNKPKIIGIGREVTALRKDGSIFPIHLSVGEIRHLPERKFVGLIRDISYQRAAEKEAREHREQLAHVDRLHMLGEMATGIAHEINQPLTAISLFAESSKRLLDAGKVEKLHEVLGKLTQHAQRAGDIIERMQNMARQHVSGQEIVDCNHVIRDTSSLAEVEARIRDIPIELDLHTGELNVIADPVQLQQVVLNLLRNGMQAMESVDCQYGSQIKIATSDDGKGVIKIAVIDCGCGVSAEVAKELFTPFSTTKESGMGMGLSICRAIAIAHGGHLDYVNNPKHGATFFITLPATQSGEDIGD